MEGSIQSNVPGGGTPQPEVVLPGTPNAPGDATGGPGVNVDTSAATLPGDALLLDGQINEQQVGSYQDMGIAPQADVGNIDQPNLPTSNGDPQLGLQTLAGFQTPAGMMSAYQNLTFPSPTTAQQDYYNSLNDTAMQYPEIVQMADNLGVSPGQIYAKVQGDRDANVQQQIANLPPDQQDKFKAAYFFKDTSNLNPDEKALLETMINQANSDVGQDMGLQTVNLNDVPPDSEAFTGQAIAVGGQSFEDAVNEAVAKGTMTQDEANQVLSVRNGARSPDSVSPHVLQLLKLMTGIAAQSPDMIALQAKYGFGPDWLPPADATAYNAIINGDFSLSMQKSVKGYYGSVTDPAKQAIIDKLIANPNDPNAFAGANLSDAEKQALIEQAGAIANARMMILQYYADPTSLSPEDLKQYGDIAKAMIDDAINGTIAKYGLDATWKPTITTLVSEIDPASLQRLQETLNTLKGILDSATEMVNAMPDGPEKDVYLDYLKTISKMMIIIQDCINEMSASNCDISKKKSFLKLQMQLANLDKQKQAAEEVQKKQGKMANMGPIGDIVKWVMYIVIVALAAAATVSTGNPLFLALAVAYVVDKETHPPGKSLLDQGFQAINSMPGVAGQVAGIIISVAICAALCCVGGALGPIMALTVFCQDSNAVQNAAALGGADKATQAICAMAVQMVLTVALMVFLWVATAGASTGAMIATVAAEMAEVTALSVSTCTKIIYVAYVACMLTVVSLQATASGIELNNNILLAQIDKIKGSADKYSAEIEAMIEVLKKLINKLLEMLQGNTDWVANISSFLGKMWGDASKLTTEITG